MQSDIYFNHILTVVVFSIPYCVGMTFEYFVDIGKMDKSIAVYVSFI